MPFIGVFGEYQISENLRLVGQLEYMDLEIDDIKGSIANSIIGLDYRFSKGFGMRLGYSFFQIDAEKDDFARRFSGLVDFRYRGPSIALSAHF